MIRIEVEMDTEGEEDGNSLPCMVGTRKEETELFRCMLSSSHSQEGGGLRTVEWMCTSVLSNIDWVSSCCLFGLFATKSYLFSVASASSCSECEPADQIVGNKALKMWHVTVWVASC